MYQPSSPLNTQLPPKLVNHSRLCLLGRAVQELADNLASGNPGMADHTAKPNSASKNGQTGAAASLSGLSLWPADVQITTV